MSIYKRGKVYWYKFEYNGQEIRKSTKSKNLRVAEEIERAYRTSLIKGEVGITERKKAPAFDEAMKSFLAWSALEHAEHPNTAKRSATSSKALLRYFGKTSLDKITAETVEEFKQVRSAQTGKRTKRKLKPATVNRELACLREMYNQVRKGLPQLVNPVSKVGVKLLAEDNMKDRVLTFAEQRAYLAEASDLLAAVAGIILETGMRPIEVYRLSVSNINLDENYLRVVKSKTKAGIRQIRINAECKRILTARIEKVKKGYLFPHEDIEGEHIPKVDSQHTAALEASGVAHFVPYDFRHTWATRAAESGIDLITLAAMMGHSRIQMVMRYAHPSQMHQASAMDKLEQFNAAKESAEKARAKLEADRRAGKNTLHVIRTA